MRLDSPKKIGAIEIKNRFIRSATAERLFDREGFPESGLGEFYCRLARGGIGAIITGHAFIEPQGRASPKQLAIFKDDFISPLKKITKEVHSCGARIFIQLSHAGRQTKSKYTGETPIAPSAVREMTLDALPRQMEEDEIYRVIDGFKKAALRAMEAGFDGSQLHAAHGYLLNQFISPYTNRRTDKWGGSTENRIRILLEILKSIKKDSGDSFAVFVKLNMDDFIDGGLKLEESVLIAGQLQEFGIDAIEASGGIWESSQFIIRKDILLKSQEAYFLDYARHLKGLIDIPVISVGGIRSKEVMEEILDTGADFVSMSRPFIREPDLANRIIKGEAVKSECISCNGCLNPRIGPIRCVQLDTVNLK